MMNRYQKGGRFELIGDYLDDEGNHFRCGEQGTIIGYDLNLIIVIMDRTKYYRICLHPQLVKPIGS